MMRTLDPLDLLPHFVQAFDPKTGDMPGHGVVDGAPGKDDLQVMAGLHSPSGQGRAVTQHS